MNSDFRVSVQFFGHFKTRRLKTRFGAAGPYALMELWAWCAQYRPDGSLSGLSDLEIQGMVGWPDSSGPLVLVMAEIGWLDGEENSRRCHDWSVWQGWVVGAPKRSEDARFAALCKRHGSDKAKKLMKKVKHAARNAVGVRGASAELDFRSAPSPILSVTVPASKEQATSKPTSMSTASTGNGAHPVADDVKAVFQHWAVKCNHPQAKLDASRDKAIRARLRDGYTPDQLRSAVDGVLRSPHNMGENDRNTVYDDISLICRDADHVDRFIRLAGSNPARAKLGAAGRQTASAMQDWLEPPVGGGHA